MLAKYNANAAGGIYVIKINGKRPVWSLLTISPMKRIDHKIEKKSKKNDADEAMAETDGNEEQPPSREVEEHPTNT